MWAGGGGRAIGSEDLYGYTVGEVDLRPNGPDPTLRIRPRFDFGHRDRRPVGFVPSRNDGARTICVPNFATASPPIRPRPDQHDFSNQFYSVVHRYGRAMPTGDERRRKHFFAYSRELVKRLVPRIQPGEWTEFDEWVKTNNKPQNFNQRLAKLFNASTSISSWECDSFIKWESYGEYKFPRSINAYDDTIKAVLGPIFRDIDRKLFSVKHFVKTVPVVDRPSLLARTFLDRSVTTTDFSSFECHHRGEFARLGAFWIHHVVGLACPDSDLRNLIVDMLLGNNVCHYSTLSCSLASTLMSGAPWTSSLNGALNLCIMSYHQLVAKYPDMGPRELARHHDEIVGFVEGDDGIFLGTGFPDLSAELGIILKREEHADCLLASFCGIVQPDADVQVIVTDPVKVIADFFVLPPKFKNQKKTNILEQFRAKAMSYYYQYHDCPIVGPLAYFVLQRTQGIHIRVERFDWYYQSILREALTHRASNPHFWEKPPEVSPQTRASLYDLYQLEPGWQYRFEHELQLWAENKPHILPHHQRLENYVLHAEQYLGSHPTGPWKNKYCCDPRLFFGDSLVNPEHAYGRLPVLEVKSGNFVSSLGKTNQRKRHYTQIQSGGVSVSLLK